MNETYVEIKLDHETSGIGVKTRKKKRQASLLRNFFSRNSAIDFPEWHMIAGTALKALTKRKLRTCNVEPEKSPPYAKEHHLQKMNFEHSSLYDVFCTPHANKLPSAVLWPVIPQFSRFHSTRHKAIWAGSN